MNLRQSDLELTDSNLRSVLLKKKKTLSFIVSECEVIFSGITDV